MKGYKSVGLSKQKLLSAGREDRQGSKYRKKRCAELVKGKKRFYIDTSGKTRTLPFLERGDNV